jgi:nitrogen fixation NifU-like protein
MTDKEKLLFEKLRTVYSETTTEHILHPCNEDAVHDPDGYACSRSGCGETMKIWLKLDHDRIRQTGFWTDGCAATIACGSIASELAKGRSVAEAMSIDAREIADALIDFPDGNFHCADLAAQTLRAALRDSLEISREPWKKFYRKCT